MALSNAEKCSGVKFALAIRVELRVGLSDMCVGDSALDSRFVGLIFLL